MVNKLRSLAVGVTVLAVVGSLSAASAVGMLGTTLSSGEAAQMAVPAKEQQHDHNVDTTIVAPQSFAQPISAKGKTVGDALASAGIAPDGDDIVNMPLDAKLKSGQKVEYVEVTTSGFTKKRSISFKTVTKESDSLPKGETKIETKGVNGAVTESYKAVFHNGVLASSSLVSSSVDLLPVDEVKLVGTKDKESTSAPDMSRRSDPPSRSAPRPPQDQTPVSGGNTCKASYYWDPQMTANGERFNPNDLTAAHKSLPFNTRVKVTNAANGKTVTVRINDRGPYVAGRCLDLSKAAMEQVGGTGAGVITAKWQVVG